MSTQTYHLKLFVIDFTHFLKSQNLEVMYNNLDNKKLLSTFFNGMVYLIGEERFNKLLEVNEFKFVYTCDEIWANPDNRDTLLFITKAAYEVWKKRNLTKKIPFIYINEELFNQLFDLTKEEFEEKDSFELNYDLLYEIQENDRKYLLEKFPHRYEQYRKFWEDKPSHNSEV